MQYFYLFWVGRSLTVNVILFTTSIPIITDEVRYTIWTIHPFIMQRQLFTSKLCLMVKLLN